MSRSSSRGSPVDGLDRGSVFVGLKGENADAFDRLPHSRICGGDRGRFPVVPLPQPDLSSVCSAVGHPSLDTLEATNALGSCEL